MEWILQLGPTAGAVAVVVLFLRFLGRYTKVVESLVEQMALMTERIRRCPLPDLVDEGADRQIDREERQADRDERRAERTERQVEREERAAERAAEAPRRAHGQ